MEYGKNKKRVLKIGAIAVLVIAAVFFGSGIRKMKEQYPPVQFADVDCGVSAELQQGVNMRVVDTKIFEMESAGLRYGEEFVQEAGTIHPYRTVEVAVRLENVSDTTQDVALYNIYIEQEDYCNGLAPEVFYGMGNESEFVSIEAGGVLEITLGYLIYEKQFRQSEWENMMPEDFCLVCSRYPEKVRWWM